MGTVYLLRLGGGVNKIKTIEILRISKILNFMALVPKSTQNIHQYLSF